MRRAYVLPLATALCRKQPRPHHSRFLDDTHEVRGKEFVYFFTVAVFVSSSKIHSIARTLYTMDKSDKNQRSPIIPKYL